MGILGAATSAERDKIIDFTRGIDSYDEDLDGNLTEDKAWKLGDIFHANPVLVPPPFLPSTGFHLCGICDANASRTDNRTRRRQRRDASCFQRVGWSRTVGFRCSRTSWIH